VQDRMNQCPRRCRCRQRARVLVRLLNGCSAQTQKQQETGTKEDAHVADLSCWRGATETEAANTVGVRAVGDTESLKK